MHQKFNKKESRLYWIVRRRSSLFAGPVSYVGQYIVEHGSLCLVYKNEGWWCIYVVKFINMRHSSEVCCRIVDICYANRCLFPPFSLHGSKQKGRGEHTRTRWPCSAADVTCSQSGSLCNTGANINEWKKGAKNVRRVNITNNEYTIQN